MNKEDRELLRHISGTLDEMLAILSKQPSRIMRVLEMVAIGAGILGILGTVEIVKGWLRG